MRTAQVCGMLRVNTRVHKIDLQGCNVSDKGFENLVRTSRMSCPPHSRNALPHSILTPTMRSLPDAHNEPARRAPGNSRVESGSRSRVTTEVNATCPHVTGLQVDVLIGRQINLKELYMSRNGITDEATGDSMHA